MFEFSTEQASNHWMLQEELSRVLQTRAAEAIEQLFDQWVSVEEVIRLDQLVIEVPPIESPLLVDEFIQNLVHALAEALRDRLSSQLPAHEQLDLLTQAPPEADWAVLLHFLTYGRLPWWQQTESLSGWIVRWEAVLQSDSTWRTSLQELLANQPAARQRLVAQLPETFCQQLIMQMQPAWTSWSMLLEDTKALLRSLQLNTSTIQYLEQRAWLSLLAEVQPHLPMSASFPTRRWLHTWLTELISVVDTRSAFAPESIYQYLQTLITNGPISNKAVWLAAMDNLAPSVRHVDVPDNTEVQDNEAVWSETVQDETVQSEIIISDRPAPTQAERDTDSVESRSNESITSSEPTSAAPSIAADEPADGQLIKSDRSIVATQPAASSEPALIEQSRISANQTESSTLTPLISERSSIEPSSIAPSSTSNLTDSSESLPLPSEPTSIAPPTTRSEPTDSSESRPLSEPTSIDPLKTSLTESSISISLEPSSASGEFPTSDESTVSSEPTLSEQPIDSGKSAIADEFPPAVDLISSSQEAASSDRSPSITPPAEDGQPIAEPSDISDQRAALPDMTAADESVVSDELIASSEMVSFEPEPATEVTLSSETIPPDRSTVTPKQTSTSDEPTSTDLPRPPSDAIDPVESISLDRSSRSAEFLPPEPIPSEQPASSLESTVPAESPPSAESPVPSELTAPPESTQPDQLIDSSFTEEFTPSANLPPASQEITASDDSSSSESITAESTVLDNHTTSSEEIAATTGEAELTTASECTQPDQSTDLFESEITPSPTPTSSEQLIIPSEMTDAAESTRSIPATESAIPSERPRSDQRTNLPESSVSDEFTSTVDPTASNQSIPSSERAAPSETIPSGEPTSANEPPSSSAEFTTSEESTTPSAASAFAEVTSPQSSSPQPEPAAERPRPQATNVNNNVNNTDAIRQPSDQSPLPSNRSAPSPSAPISSRAVSSEQISSEQISSESSRIPEPSDALIERATSVSPQAADSAPGLEPRDRPPTDTPAKTSPESSPAEVSHAASDPIPSEQPSSSELLSDSPSNNTEPPSTSEQTIAQPSQITPAPSSSSDIPSSPLTTPTPEASTEPLPVEPDKPVTALSPADTPTTDTPTDSLADSFTGDAPITSQTDAPTVDAPIDSPDNSFSGDAPITSQADTSTVDTPTDSQADSFTGNAPITSQADTPTADASIDARPEPQTEQQTERPLPHSLMANPPKRASAPILSRAEQANGIYLNNAGLVLLHPFLRIYFEDVGLLAENNFRHEYAQQVAIALLHYLATGQTGVPEYALVLPKLL
ncbi:MAG: hypothetical protein F6K19_06015, partial [Cyanothece sp. SIO1E1]|nr:hypothetical protein [Cyanothece sp. SIO1E1]